METDLDVQQFLSTMYRYIQLGVHIKAFYSKEYGKFHREVDEVCEFYVDDDNVPKSRIIYQKIFGQPMMCKPSKHLIEYIENQNLEVQSIISGLPDELPIRESIQNEKKTEEKGSTEVANKEPVIVPLSTKTVEKPVLQTVSSQPTINPVPLTPTLSKLEG